MKSRLILEKLLQGRKISVKSVMISIGTHKLSTRLGELERKYDFLAHRKWVEVDGRFGVERYYEYWLDKKTISNLKKRRVLKS